MKMRNQRVFSWCEKHQKNTYLTRKAARRSAHIDRPGEHKQAYQCDVGPDRYHYGAVPPAALYGLKSVSEIYGRGSHAA